MPITSSAKKAIRSSLKKHVFNLARASAVKNVIKEIRKFAALGKKKEAEALLSKAFKAIDKAAKEHTIDKNNAARKKSRLVKLIRKIA